MTQITEEVRDQLLEASAATRKAFSAFRREADPDDHYQPGEGAQAAADKAKDDLEMSAVVTIMQPILRFLQLLCENHNRDLQVRAGRGRRGRRGGAGGGAAAALAPTLSSFTPAGFLESRTQDGSRHLRNDAVLCLSVLPTVSTGTGTVSLAHQCGRLLCVCKCVRVPVHMHLAACRCVACRCTGYTWADDGWTDRRIDRQMDRWMTYQTYTICYIESAN